MKEHFNDNILEVSKKKWVLQQHSGKAAKVHVRNISKNVLGEATPAADVLNRIAKVIKYLQIIYAMALRMIIVGMLSLMKNFYFSSVKSNDCPLIRKNPLKNSMMFLSINPICKQ